MPRRPTYAQARRASAEVTHTVDGVGCRPVSSTVRGLAGLNGRRVVGGTVAFRSDESAPARLLLVEDNGELSGMLVRILSAEGYAVTWAADGQRGLQHGLIDDFDVVVLDWSLPALDGLDVLQAWRACGVMTPTLVLSARGAARDREAGLAAGAQDYLVKPFDVGELLARVRAIQSC